MKSKVAFTVLLLFCVFFGLTFVVPDDIQGAADSARYARELANMHSNSFTFLQFKNYLYSDESGSVDIYQPLITWAVSQFTGNPKWLFAIFALVFGFFYLQNIRMLIEEISGSYRFLLLVILVLFVLINPIWNINGVRMWTAAQVFLYGVMLIYLKGKNEGFLWAFLSILIHFSYVFPLILLLGFRFLPKNSLLLFLFFIFSFMVSELNIELIRVFAEDLPDVFQSRVNSYTSDQVLEKFSDRGNDQLSFHVVLAGRSQAYIMFFFLILIFFLRNKFSYYNVYCLNFLNLALFFTAWANIASIVPSGGRFILIANSLTLIALILYLGKIEYKEKWIKLIYPLVPFILFIIVFKIREGADYFGFMTLFGNPLLALFVEDNVPFIVFIKSLL